MTRPRDPARAWPPLDPAALADARALAAVECCRWRASTCGCLTVPATCGLNEPASVTLADCLACPVKDAPRSDAV